MPRSRPLWSLPPFHRHADALSIEPSCDAERYAGTGECFLLRLVPRSFASTSVSSTSDDDDGGGDDYGDGVTNNADDDDIEAQTYAWSRRNELFQRADLAHGIWMGSGTQCSGYGFFIDNAFERGTSVRCETYDNEPLATHEHFEVRFIELWAVR